MNILVVDDIPMNRKLLRVVLEGEGHCVLEAADGVEALQVLDREKIEAVIADILMPNMDGFRLCHEIRKSARWHELPFIIYTATYNSPNDMKLAESVGADRYLMKPAPAQEVLRAIQESLAKPRTRPTVDAEQARETEVLKQYSQALVNKLEEKNRELQESTNALKRAHERILRLNADLEVRVLERTTDLETANQRLSQALAEVKELRGVLPLCLYCKKISDDKNYWQSVESYVVKHTRSHFSHGVCPECYQEHVLPQLAEMAATADANL